MEPNTSQDFKDDTTTTPEVNPPMSDQPQPQPQPFIVEEPTTSKPKTIKLKNLIILAIIIYVIASFGFLIYTFVMINYWTSSPETFTSVVLVNDEPSDEPTTNTTEEVEITDARVLRDLDDKLAILHHTDDTSTTMTMHPSIFSEYRLYSDEGLNEMDKIYTIYGYTYGKNLHNEPSQKQIEDLQTNLGDKVSSDLIGIGPRVIDASIFSGAYQDVFGEKVNLNIVNDKNDICPTLRYDSSTNLLYGFHGCGGTSPFERYYYKNRYTTDGDHAYVYINAGVIDLEESKIYCEVNVDTSTPCGDYDDVADSNFTIDASNHDKFAEYRFTFTKATDGTYYFEEVEKIN